MGHEEVSPGLITSLEDLLDCLGENRSREGLSNTPLRAAKAWEFWTSGMFRDPKDVITTFDEAGENYNQMVVVSGIHIYSHCEHHLAPFFGEAVIGYIPDGKVLGLSKLNRIADIYSRRLQVQERLTSQIAECLDTLLSPKGVGVLVRCRHMCMESRGVQQRGTLTTTSAVRGCIDTEPSSRAEFMSLIGTLPAQV